MGSGIRKVLVSLARAFWNFCKKKAKSCFKKIFCSNIIHGCVGIIGKNIKKVRMKTIDKMLFLGCVFMCVATPSIWAKGGAVAAVAAPAPLSKGKAVKAVVALGAMKALKNNNNSDSSGSSPTSTPPPPAPPPAAGAAPAPSPAPAAAGPAAPVPLSKMAKILAAVTAPTYRYRDNAFAGDYCKPTNLTIEVAPL